MRECVAQVGEKAAEIPFQHTSAIARENGLVPAESFEHAARVT